MCEGQWELIAVQRMSLKDIIHFLQGNGNVKLFSSFFFLFVTRQETYHSHPSSYKPEIKSIRARSLSMSITVIHLDYTNVRLSKLSQSKM